MAAPSPVAALMTKLLDRTRHAARIGIAVALASPAARG
jgi:hypothetical protein